MSNAITLSLVEHALDALGEPHTIVQLCEPGGAEAMAARLLAEDPAASAEFGSDPDLLAAYLRSKAVPQRRDAERAIRNPHSAPRLSLLPTPVAAMHAATTGARGTALAAPAAVAAPVPTAATSERSTSVRLAVVAPPTKIRLGTGAGGPCPFDRAIVAQHPDRYCL